jgi:phenylacetate-coenzyme A ligase PaaK-like adenylate-forming protein
MLDLTPPRESLDPIEVASRDEIQALQLERLRWSLRHAYENVAVLESDLIERSAVKAQRVLDLRPGASPPA